MNKEMFSELLTFGTGAQLDYDLNETFIDAFLRQVAKTPDATAVVDECGSITYGELDRRSDFIAAELLKTGMKAGGLVAVKLPRVKEFVVAVIGIWKAGGAYMPVDPTYPEKRIRYMLEDSGAEVTIDESWMDRLRYNGSPVPASVNDARPECTAIIIYTSGSTGRPKGVLNTHAGIRALCYGMSVMYDYRPGDKAKFDKINLTLLICGTVSQVQSPMKSSASSWIQPFGLSLRGGGTAPFHTDSTGTDIPVSRLTFS